jgi:hypothetical protein
VLEQVGHFLHSPVNSFVQGLSLIGNRKRLGSYKKGFDHAAHIAIATLLIAVHIAQVNINMSNEIAKSAQALFHYTT